MCERSDQGRHYRVFARRIGVFTDPGLTPHLVSWTLWSASFSDPGGVAGLVWRAGDGIVCNAPAPILEDLDEYPYPDRKTLSIDYLESMPLDVPAVLSHDRVCTMP